MLKNCKRLTFLSGAIVLLSTYSVYAMDQKDHKNNNENSNNQNIPIKQKDHPAAGPSLKVPAASSAAPTGDAPLDKSLSTTSVSSSQHLNPPGTNKDAATSSSGASISLSPEALSRINSIVDEDYSHHPPEYRHTPEYDKETAGHRQEVTDWFVKFGDDHTLVSDKLIRKLLNGSMLTEADFEVINYIERQVLVRQGNRKALESFDAWLEMLEKAR